MDVENHPNIIILHGSLAKLQQGLYINSISEMDNIVIGIIGMGDMGKMYARRLGDAGWR